MIEKCCVHGSLYSYPYVIMFFRECGPLLWSVQDVDYRLYLYNTCLVYFSVLICLKRTWGMIFMILSPAGGSRTWCILVLCYLEIYEHVETFALKLHILKCLQGWWGWRIFLISQKIVIRDTTLLPGREFSLTSSHVGSRNDYRLSWVAWGISFSISRSCRWYSSV